jgi:hypothetical protein
VVTYAGRVVNKDALLAAVCPEVVVTEGVLKTCLGQLPGQRSTPSAPERIIGREIELVQLQRWWMQALQDARRTMFATGEAGIGKTTVVEAFVAQVVAPGRDLSARGGNRADTSRARRDAGASLAWAMCGAGRGTGRAICARQRLGTCRTASVVCRGAGGAGAGRGEPGTDPSSPSHSHGYRA